MDRGDVNLVSSPLKFCASCFKFLSKGDKNVDANAIAEIFLLSMIQMMQMYL